MLNIEGENKLYMSNATIISSEKNWLEQVTVNQLIHISTLPGVVKAVGLPDLHPGKTPVGAAIVTEGIIYPHLVGNDIGCGMAMFMTDIEKKKLKLERLIKNWHLAGCQTLSKRKMQKISQVIKERCGCSIILSKGAILSGFMKVRSLD